MLGQNAPMEEGKINQCNEVFSTDAFDENLPVHYGNLHEPLPEITTIIHQRLLHIFLQRIPPTYPSMKKTHFI